ncbi:hypothetical protein [Streptomyces sp. NPDC005568]|uniref:hypothetical protein n=1 Tax=Streptomyces sp. NPDC005568 TaxID=3156887 RepID=UPI0033A4A0D2
MAAGAGMLAGLSVVAYGAYRGNLAHVVAGTCLTLVTLTVCALVFIRKWILDTRDERRILGATQRAAEVERSRYVAAQAALENEQGRLRQDVAAEHHALAVRLTAERAALTTEFEAKRGEYMAEAMEVAVRLIVGKKLDPTQVASAKLIQFPQSLPHQQRERSREHGVVGP